MRETFAVVMLALILTIVGCAQKTTVNTPEGRVDVSQQGQKMTVETKEGKVEMTQPGRKMAMDLGVPVYPGAAPQGSVAVSESSQEKGAAQTVIFTTKDPVEKVLDYYKQQLPPSAKVTNIASSGVVVATVETEKDGKAIHINITGNPKEGTTISIVSEKAEGKE